jgi:hypothetical protein
MRLKCLSVVSETFTKDGKTDVSVSGTDRAGNVGVSGVFPVWMDSMKPTASIAADPPENGAGWHKDIPTLNISTADAEPGNGPGQEASGAESITYQFNNDPVQTAADVSATFTVSEGRNTVRYTAIDAAGNESQTYTASVKVDLSLPTSQVTLTPDENNAGWVNANTTVGFTATDPAGSDGAAGSGPAKVTYSATADATKGGATIASTDTAGSSASRPTRARFRTWPGTSQSRVRS